MFSRLLYVFDWFFGAEGEAWIEYSWYDSESAESDDNLLEQTLSYSVRVQVNF